MSQALLHFPGLKEADALHRFLTDEQVNKLRADFKRQVELASTPVQERNALLDLAAFYLLWHGGLRLSELEDLKLSDLYLRQQRIVIRQAKGVKDRTVYLTPAATAALEGYLEVRGPGNSDHLFLYRHRQLSKDLVRGRLKAAGQRTGVKVTPHMLRHTFATQLVNAGCRITTIQALLGHERLNTTMIYARVYDKTVADDYYKAMALIEQRLQPSLARPMKPEICSNGVGNAVNGSVEHDLLALISLLVEGISAERRRVVASELREGLVALLEVM